MSVPWWASLLNAGKHHQRHGDDSGFNLTFSSWDHISFPYGMFCQPTAFGNGLIASSSATFALAR
jgi:hypothetical protein